MADSEQTYEPFLPFKTWRSEDCDVPLTETYRSLMEEAAAKASSQYRSAALENVMRTAALETGAIEDLYETNRGVTVTVAGMAAGWEAELAQIGPEVREHFEAQLEAFEMVLDLATRRAPISAAWIRELHAQVTRNQKTYRARTVVGFQELELHHGSYKTQPNTVLTTSGELRWYAPVHDTEPEMARLASEISSEEFAMAPAQLQAAFVHYAFVAIHPFEDGNGRVARALASVFLYRYAGVPLVVFSDQRAKYWAALKAADLGDRSQFVRFIEDRLIDTLSTVRLLLGSSESIPGNAQQFVQKMFGQPRERTPQEMTAVTSRLSAAVARAMESSWNTALTKVSPAQLSTTTHAPPVSGNLPNWDDSYSPSRTGEDCVYRLHLTEPADLEATLQPTIGQAADQKSRYTFVVVDPHRPSTDILYVRVDDADPEISASLQVQIEGWSKAAVRRVIAEFLSKIEGRVRKG